MPEAPKPTPSKSTSRAEKLSVLSALLGPEALAKLREGEATADPAPKGAEVDADRAAWHRNKLLERLRGKALRAPQDPQGDPDAKARANPHMRGASRRDEKPAQPPANGTALGSRDVALGRSEKSDSAAPTGLGVERPQKTELRSADLNPVASRSSSLGDNLAAIADPATLAQEHPAVIARLVRNLPREERIVAIKSLPGPLARSILHRLR